MDTLVSMFDGDATSLQGDAGAAVIANDIIFAMWFLLNAKKKERRPGKNSSHTSQRTHEPHKSQVEMVMSFTKK